jgi:hypothetical protein
VKRRLVTLAAAISMVLCMATLTMWGLSYWRFQGIIYYEADRGRGIQNVFGEVQIVTVRFRALGVVPPEKLGWSFENREADEALKLSPVLEEAKSLFGFAFASVDHPPDYRLRAIAIPHWFLALLFTILPAIRLRIAVRSRQSTGHCPQCGYDLRATPERCPECGAKPAAT